MALRDPLWPKDPPSTTRPLQPLQPLQPPRPAKTKPAPTLKAKTVKAPAPVPELAAPARAIPKRRATDKLGEDSGRFPHAQWPVATREERIALLDAITAQLRLGRLDATQAYHERLHWAFRCLKEGV